MGINNRVELEELLETVTFNDYERSRVLKDLRLPQTESEVDEMVHVIWRCERYVEEPGVFQYDVELNLKCQFPMYGSTWQRHLIALEEPDLPASIKDYCEKWVERYLPKYVNQPSLVLFNNCCYYDFMGIYDFQGNYWFPISHFKTETEFRQYVQVLAAPLDKFDSSLPEMELGKTASSIVQDIANREIKALELSRDGSHKEANIRHWTQILKHAMKIV